MTAILHPTDCECEYEFPHTFIIAKRVAKIDGYKRTKVTTMVICRECGHWLDAKVECKCAFRCHGERGGTSIAITPLDGVN